MKKLIVFVLLLVIYKNCLAQSSIIQPGNMRLPGQTSSEILAINTPQKGMMVFDTDARCIKYYNGTEWICTSSTKGIVPQNQMAQRVGSNSYEDIGICIATDNQGNIYLGFNFTGSGTYGGVSYNTYNYCINAYTQSIILMKITADGIIAWTTIVYEAQPRDLEVDASQNVYLIARQITYDNPGNCPLNRVPKETIKKFNAGGTLVWQRYYHAVNREITDLALSATGIVYAAGTMHETSTFDTATLNQIGLDDIFILKLSGVDGTEIWAKRAGGTADDRCESIEAEGENFYMTGSIGGSANFGNNATTHNLVATLQNDAFIVKYNTDSEVLWLNRIGGNGNDRGKDLSIDTNGSVYLVGSYSGQTLAVNDYTNTTEDPDGVADGFFISKFLANGVLSWLRHGGRTNNTEPVFLSIASNNAGNCFVAGTFQKCVSFAQNDLVSIGKTDVFIAKYDSEGKPDWVAKGGGNQDDRCFGIVNAENKIYATGSFKQAAYFGGVNLTTSASIGQFLYKIKE